MRFDFIPKKIESKDGKFFYAIIPVLRNGNDVIKEGKVLLWITEEQFQALTSSK